MTHAKPGGDWKLKAFTLLGSGEENGEADQVRMRITNWLLVDG